MTRAARTAGFGISAADSVTLWLASSGLQAAHCAQSEAAALQAVARHRRARAWRYITSLLVLAQGPTRGGGKHHPTVFRPPATKTVFLINQPTNRLVRQRADLSTSAENLILVLVSPSRSRSGGGPLPLLLTGVVTVTFYCRGCWLSQSLQRAASSRVPTTWCRGDGGEEGERTFLYP